MKLKIPFIIALCLTVIALQGRSLANWELQYTLPSGSPLRGIWGISGSDVFAVGGGKLGTDLF